MSSTAISYTPGSAPTNKKWTFSAWIKRSILGTDQTIFEGRQNGSNLSRITFRGGSATNQDSLQLYSENSGTTNVQLQTARKFRDVNGWYHIVTTVDTTLSTEADRVKIYVNGVRETSFLTSNYPAQEYSGWWIGIGPNVTQVIGSDTVSGSEKFSGIMSHINYTIGYAYQASTFGSIDTTTGEWKINTSPSVTYGATGFFILKDGNSLTDQSGNGKNFTLGAGTLTKTEDNPSNVFATMNPLVKTPNGTYSNGNTQFNGGSAHRTAYGTLAFSTGKYYWEAKATGGTKYTIGLSDVENQSAYQQVAGTNLIVGNQANSYISGDAIGWYSTEINKNGSAVASGLTAVGTNDILRVAVDADAGKLYYAIGATWRVANSTTFNASSNDTTFTTGRYYVPACSNENCGWKFNFGNGYFGTDAVASAGTNALGNGIFEYDVPTGFTALSTKGLNL